MEADLFMVTLQAEPHAAAEIAEIAWIDPTAPGGIVCLTGVGTGGWTAGHSIVAARSAVGVRGLAPMDMAPTASSLHLLPVGSPRKPVLTSRASRAQARMGA